MSNVFRLAHPINAPRPMNLTELGKLVSVSVGQLLNAKLPIDVIATGRVTTFSSSISPMLSNAPSLIDVTLAGRSTCMRFVFRKTLIPIEERPQLLMPSKVVRPTHSANAMVPISRKFAQPSILTYSRTLQSLKHLESTRVKFLHPCRSSDLSPMHCMNAPRSIRIRSLQFTKFRIVSLLHPLKAAHSMRSGVGKRHSVYVSAFE